MSLCKLTYSLWLCLLLTSNASAQFIVVSAHFASDLANRELKMLDTLQAGTQIQLGKGGYLAIIHPSGQYWEADSAGKYQIPDLSENIALKLNLKPYLTGSISKKPLNTGAVTAGMPDYPLIFLPDKQINILGDSIEFTWWKMLDYQQEDTSQNTEFEVQFSNIFEDSLCSINSDNKLLSWNWANFLETHQIDSTDMGDEVLLISIISKGEKRGSYNSPLHAIKRVSEKRSEELLASLKQLQAKKNSIFYLAKAIFLAEENLPLDALFAFQKAIGSAKYSIDYQEFKNSYLEYLKNKGKKNY